MLCSMYLEAVFPVCKHVLVQHEHNVSLAADSSSQQLYNACKSGTFPAPGVFDAKP